LNTLNATVCVYANSNVLNANYNSLQMQLRQRFDHGLTYSVAYTWSRAFDETSGINNVSGNNGFIQDPHNIQADYGPSNFDEPNRLTVNGVYELPMGKGGRWSAGRLNPVLGGWKVSGIYTINSGRTLTAYGYAGPGYDEMGAPFSSRYRLVQSGSANSGFTRSYTEWFNTSVFSTAPQGEYGNERKGILRGPYFADLDLSLAKVFSLTERQRLQARFEMFNVGSNWHQGAVFPDGGFGDSNFGSLVPKTKLRGSGLRFDLGARQSLEAAYHSVELGIFLLVNRRAAVYCAAARTDCSCGGLMRLNRPAPGFLFFVSLTHA
jgi:hypothetical protein